MIFGKILISKAGKMFSFSYWEIFGIVLVTLYFVLSLLFPKTKDSPKDKEKPKEEDAKGTAVSSLSKDREKALEKPVTFLQENVRTEEDESRDVVCSSNTHGESTNQQLVTAALHKPESTPFKLRETVCFSGDNKPCIPEVASVSEEAVIEPLQANLIETPKLSELVYESVSSSEETQESLEKKPDRDVHVVNNEEIDNEMQKSDKYPSKYLHKEFKNGAGRERLPSSDAGISGISDSTDKPGECSDSREIYSTESKNLRSKEVSASNEVENMSLTAGMTTSPFPQNNNNLEKFADGLASSTVETAVDNSVCFSNFAENLSDKIFWASADDVISEVHANIEQQNQESSLNNAELLKPIKLDSLSSNVASEVVNEAVGEAALKEEYMSDDETELVTPQRIQPHLGYVVENVVNNAICEAALKLKREEEEDEDIDNTDVLETAIDKEDSQLLSESHDVSDSNAETVIQSDSAYHKKEESTELFRSSAHGDLYDTASASTDYIDKDNSREIPEDQQSVETPKEEVQISESKGNVNDTHIEQEKSTGPTESSDEKSCELNCVDHFENKDEELKYQQFQSTEVEGVTEDKQAVELERKDHVEAKQIDQEILSQEEEYSANESTISLPSEYEKGTPKEQADTKETQSELTYEQESEQVNRNQPQKLSTEPDVNDIKEEYKKSTEVIEVDVGDADTDHKADGVPEQSDIENETEKKSELTYEQEVEQVNRNEPDVNDIKIEHKESTEVKVDVGDTDTDHKADDVPDESDIENETGTKSELTYEQESEQVNRNEPDVNDIKIEHKESTEVKVDVGDTDTDHKAHDVPDESDIENETGTKSELTYEQEVEQVNRNEPDVNDIKVEYKESTELIEVDVGDADSNHKADDVPEQSDIENETEQVNRNEPNINDIKIEHKENTEDVDVDNAKKIEHTDTDHKADDVPEQSNIENETEIKNTVISPKEIADVVNEETENRNISESCHHSVSVPGVTLDRSESTSESEENIASPDSSPDQTNKVTLRAKPEETKESFWRRSLILDLEQDFELEESFSSDATSPDSPKPIQLSQSEERSEGFSDSEEDEIIDHDADATLGAVGGSQATNENFDEEAYDFYDYGSDENIVVDNEANDDDDDDDEDIFEPFLTVDGLCASKQTEKGLKRKGNLKSVGSHYNRAIVLDNGCGYIKMGYAGDRVPRVNQQTVSGIPSRYSMQMTGLGTNLRDFKKFGSEAVSKAGVMHLSHPMSAGLVDNWTDVEDIWEFMMSNELGAEVGDNPIIVTEISQNPKKNREKITEILFEHLNVPAMYLADQLPLSIYASGLTSGLCLSSGYSCSQAAVIYEGHTLSYTVQQLDIGGGHLTENLKLLLRDNRGHNFTTSSGLQIVNDIKETIAFVAKDYKSEIQNYKTNDSLTKYYTLPDGQIIDIGYECMSCVEPLFQPGELMSADATTASQAPVHEMVNNAIKRCDKEMQRMCHNNVVLSGGTTLLKGFTSRLQHELRPINHSIRKIRTPDHRHYSPWIGGSILGSLSVIEEQYVTMDEYGDSGPRIVHKKCF